MDIFPAIDILSGKAVRLRRGDYNDITVYSDDPARTAEGFRDTGARHLHIVDLDGAKRGEPVNFATVERIARSSGLFCEIGGGVRDMARISAYLELGIDRVILGSAAITDPKFLSDAIATFGSRIAVGVDAREGRVATQGWTSTTDVLALDFCKRLYDMGVSRVIYTDISRDGMLSGVNLPAYEALTRIEGLKITASGGVSGIGDIAALSDIGIDAVITGKAVYEDESFLARALAAAKGGTYA